MYQHYDPDEWETVATSQPCTACGGDLRKCNGACNGSTSISHRRRSPEDVQKIKAEKTRLREDAILAEAAEIKQRRYRANQMGD